MLARFLFADFTEFVAMVKKYKKTDERSYALGATVTMELLNAR